MEEVAPEVTQLHGNTIVLCPALTDEVVPEVTQLDGDSKVSTTEELLQKRIAELQSENEALTSENTAIKEEMGQLNKELNSINSQYQHLLKALHRLFSEGILNRLLTGHATKLTSDDIRYSLTIYKLSSKCYNYLRNSLQYPFPCESTLRAWASKITCEPGLLHNIIQIMMEKGKSMDSFEKLIVLSFDEMKISERVCYDTRHDQIIGPNKMVQVVMARGLCGNWKQPIFYDFDQPVKLNLLHSLIVELNNINFTVVAIVCDLGGSNQGLWRELKVEIGQPWFINPADSGKKVFVFADAPHLLKLVRNHFIDSGFNVRGMSIDTRPLYEILSLKAKELTVAFKLSSDHLNVRKKVRQKVKLAVQLFSNSVASAVEYLGIRQKIRSSNWNEVSNFIKSMNDWFDVMNTRVPSLNFQHLKKAYGFSLEQQNTALDKVDVLIRSSLVNGKNTLLPFQKAILMNNSSLKSLYAYLSNLYGLTYILTYRLNQDVVECFFSQIRAMGRTYDHPSPLEFKYRIRNQIIGRNCKYISSGANISGDDSEYFNLFEAPTSDNEALDGETVPPVIMLSADYLSIVQSEECVETGEICDDSTVYSLNSNECEYGGEEYLAGYLAHIAETRYGIQCLSDATGLLNINASPPTWVDLLSDGGLKKPTPEFFRKFKCMEAIFLKYHGLNGVRRDKGVMSHLEQMIAAAIDLPKQLVKHYVRTRTFIRIRMLNSAIHSKNLSLQTQKGLHKTVV